MILQCEKGGNSLSLYKMTHIYTQKMIIINCVAITLLTDPSISKRLL